MKKRGLKNVYYTRQVLGLSFHCLVFKVIWCDFGEGMNVIFCCTPAAVAIPVKVGLAPSDGWKTHPGRLTLLCPGKLSRTATHLQKSWRQQLSHSYDPAFDGGTII